MNTGLLGELARASCRHIKNTLPPSLCVLPGQAEIRYFVKATVHRQAFYKENFRAVSALSARTQAEKSKNQAHNATACSFQFLAN